MTLVDSSVWINWLRGRDTPASLRLDELLDEGQAAICPVIVQELLQGAANPEQLAALRRRVDLLPLLDPAPAVVLHAQAGALYANCRWAGITPRSPPDCLIAVTAIVADVVLLHDDADFPRIAGVEPRLRLVAG